MQESVKITEPILCLRRVMLNEAKKLLEEQRPSAVPLIDSLLGECWLTSAKTARSAAVSYFDGISAIVFIKKMM